MSTMKVMGIEWFTSGRGMVGIASVDMDDELSDENPPPRVVRCFVAPVSGLDDASDIQTVANWGARMPDKVGKALFPQPLPPELHQFLATAAGRRAIEHDLVETLAHLPPGITPSVDVYRQITNTWVALIEARKDARL